MEFIIVRNLEIYNSITIYIYIYYIYMKYKNVL
jgi:hypothetical protein